MDTDSFLQSTDIGAYVAWDDIMAAGFWVIHFAKFFNAITPVSHTAYAPIASIFKKTESLLFLVK